MSNKITILKANCIKKYERKYLKDKNLLQSYKNHCILCKNYIICGFLKSRKKK